MFVFGHLGITLGAAALLTGVRQSSRSPETARNSAVKSSSSSSPVVPNQKTSWLSYLGSRVDIRLLLIGSLLPDIIDKPIGRFFFREAFSNGKIFGHTLLFLILVTMAGIYLYRRYNQTWCLTFSFGTATHLVLDRMWLIPRTLFWPLMGFTFDRVYINNWAWNVFHTLYTDPKVLLIEIVGALIFVWFAWLLRSRRKIYAFIRYGQV